MFIFQLKHKLREYSETKKTELMRNRHSLIKKTFYKEQLVSSFILKLQNKGDVLSL